MPKLRPTLAKVNYVLFVSLAVFGLTSTIQAQSLFIPVKQLGMDTPLHKKVLVRTDKATIHPAPNAPGEKIESFAIFHKLYVDPTAKQEKQGEWVRVGNSEGKHLGWIKEEHLYEWNSRFLLDPIPPVGDKQFTIYTNQQKNQVFARMKKMPPKGLAIAPILEPPGRAAGEPVYKVAFFTGTAQSKVKKEVINPLKGGFENMKLEIMFVIDTTSSMRNMLSGTKEVVEKCANTLAADPNLKGAVKFGLVEYQDNVKDLIPSRLISPLTDDIGAFQNKLRPLQVTRFGSIDPPEQVIAGVLTAIQRAGWDDNSSRHIILLGDASCKEGSQNVAKISGKTVNLKRLIDEARRSSGESAEQIVKGKITLHAIRAEQIGSDSARAKVQFQEIARNNNELAGIYLDLNANNPTSRTKAVTELTNILSESFASLKKIRQSGGQVKAVGNELNNPITRNFYEIVNAKGKDKLGVTSDGYAAERNDKGSRIAMKKLIVYKDEMIRLESTLNFLHAQFKLMANPSKRGNVKTVLNVLKQVAAVVASGQEVNANTNLGDFITALPLKTSALKISARDLAILSQERFENWLENLKSSAERARGVLDSPDWYVLSSKEDAQYTFLHLSQMP